MSMCDSQCFDWLMQNKLLFVHVDTYVMISQVVRIHPKCKMRATTRAKGRTWDLSLRKRTLYPLSYTSYEYKFT